MADGYIGMLDHSLGKRQECSVSGSGDSALYRQRVEVYGSKEDGLVRVIPTDVVGNAPFSTVFNEQLAGLRFDDIDVLFQYNNSTKDISAVTTGSGTTANVSSMAEVAIDTTAGDSQITSLAAIRYKPGHESFAYFTALFSGAQSGVKQYIGALNDADGVCFGTKDGVFGCWFISGGVETFIPQSSWNGRELPASFAHDPTKLNLYCVRYGWLGAAPLVYCVYAGREYGWIPVHYHDVVNQQTTPTLGNPSLTIRMKVARASGTGTAAHIRSGSWNGHCVEGIANVTHADRWFSYAVLDATPADFTLRNHIFTIKNASTFQGKVNHVPIEIAIVSFANATNKTLAFYGVKNATLSGASAYSDIDATNSVASVSTGGTLTGTRGPVVTLQKDISERIDVRGTDIIVYPGETFSFEVVSASPATGTVSVSCRWIEKF